MVRGYKHLGTYLQEDCRPSRDIVHKKALARQAWGPLLRPFFMRREISDKTKADIFSSLIMSRYSFQVHTWSWVSRNTLDSWCTGIRPLLFPLVKCGTRGCSVELLDTATLCGLANMMTPRDLMAKQRLQYAKRALVHGPVFLWTLVVSVEDHDGWAHWFGEDLQWLLKFSPMTFLDVATTDVRTWLQFIAESDDWSQWVKQAAKACVRYRARQSQAKVWELHVADTLQKHWVQCCPRVVVPGSIECTLCGQTFRSKRALAMHSHAIHGYLPEVKFFAPGSMCLSCGKEYHHRPRLICHLNANHRCLDHLRGCFPPIPNEIVKELDTQDRSFAMDRKAMGWKKCKALLPALRVPSVALPPCGSAEANRMWNFWQAIWETPGDAFCQMNGVLRDSDIPIDNAQPEYPAFVFQSDCGKHSGHNGVFDLAGISQIGTVKVWCLSVDLCLQGSDGDLMDRKVQQKWIEALKSRRIIGGGGASPCETFSAARFHDGVPRHFGQPTKFLDCQICGQNTPSRYSLAILCFSF